MLQELAALGVAALPTDAPDLAQPSPEAQTSPDDSVLANGLFS